MFINVSWWESLDIRGLQMLRSLLVMVLALLVLTPCVARGVELEYDLVEGTPADTQVCNVVVEAGLEADYGSGTAQLQFSLLPQSAQYAHFFSIHPQTGVITTSSNIDRDAECDGALLCDMVLFVGVLTPDLAIQTVTVTIHLRDVNDNAPYFNPNRHDLSISETAAPGTLFPLPLALDPDSDMNGVQSYSLREASTVFGLNVVQNHDGSMDLKLVLNQQLDREDVEYYSLFVVARDGGSPPLSGTLTLSVTVLDANDNHPTFTNQSYSTRVAEDTPAGSAVFTVLATDLDEGINGEVRYSWDSATAASYGHLFTINTISGVISLNEELDYEGQESYSLTVIASDRGSSGVPSQVRVTINVGDVNDFPPSISVDAPFSSSGRIEVPENSDSESYVAHVTVEDGDSGPSGEVSCAMYGGPFTLQQEQGTRNIFTMVSTESLDRESIPQYTVTVQCTDMGHPPITSHQDVLITVLDKNDHRPVFRDTTPFAVSLLENVTIGHPVLRINGTDADSGENSRLTYSLQGQGSNLFHIDPDMGLVITKALLDYESTQQIVLEVVVRDNGDLYYTVNASLTINLVDVNDENPIFERAAYEFGSYENQSVGTEIGVVTATDKDIYPFNDIVYSLRGNQDILDTFTIGATNGRIEISRPLDREYREEYVFQVVAMNPGYPNTESAVYVSVIVADINDNAPQLIFPAPNNNTVQVPHLAPVGFFFARVSAVDADIGINNRLTYTFGRPVEDRVFDIDSFTGALTVRADISRKTSTQYHLLLMVRDNGSPPQSATAEMIVVVNRTIPFIVGPNQGQHNMSVNLNQSQTVLISLAMITVLLVTILVVAIILVKRRQAKQQEEEEALRHGCSILPDHLSSSTDSGSRSTKESNTMNDLNQSYSESYDTKPNMNDMKYDKNLNNGHGNQYNNKEYHSNQGKYDFPPSTLVKLQNGHGTDAVSLDRHSQLVPGSHNSSFQASTSQPPPAPPRHRINASPAQMIAEPWRMTPQELAVHSLVHKMSAPPPPHPVAGVVGEDSDAASSCSADVSNTDSGRGPSEDGDSSLTPEHGSQSPQRQGPPQRPPKRKHVVEGLSVSGQPQKASLEQRHSLPLAVPTASSCRNHMEYLQMKNMHQHPGNQLTSQDKKRLPPPRLTSLAHPGRASPLSHHNVVKHTNMHNQRHSTKDNIAFTNPTHYAPQSARCDAGEHDSSSLDRGRLMERPTRRRVRNGSLERALSIASTLDESDSGSTTSGEYTVDGDTLQSSPRQKSRPITSGGSFV